MKGTAAAVRDLVKRMIDTHVARNYLGVVTHAAAPVKVKLDGTDMDLSEEETLLLSHVVLKYDFEHGLALGDTLLLVAAHGGHYVATAVISNRQHLGGVRQKVFALGGHLAGTVTAGHVTVDGTDYPVLAGVVSVPVVGKAPYCDADGNTLGEVPVV